MARLFAVFVSFLLALCAGNAFAQAAYVHNLNGTATASTGGAERALKIGDLLSSGTTISTGDKSNAVIKFEDGQVMVLGERSSFRIVEYRYNKQRVADSSAVFNLVRGGLRFITGVIGATNRNNFRMTAGTATIGIRGTSATVYMDEVARVVMAAVYVGSLELVTKEGNATVNAGQISTYDPTKTPSVTAPQLIDQADGAVRARLLSYLAIETPVNLPVDLTASAAAAAAVAQARLLRTQAATNPALEQAALDAEKVAEAAVLKAIQAAQEAYDEAIKGGARRPDPDVPPIPEDILKEQIKQLSAPGGAPCSVASCN